MKYAFHLQVKAVLRGELPPFSSAYVEAVMAVVNLQSKQARKLQSSSTRYWGIEYLRRQPQGMHFQALVLRFLKEREPVILIEEVCCGVLHMIRRQRFNNLLHSILQPLRSEVNLRTLFILVLCQCRKVFLGMAWFYISVCDSIRRQLNDRPSLCQWRIQKILERSNFKYFIR